MKLSLLSAAIFVALSSPAAFAQSEKEIELERRVAELEKKLEALSNAATSAAPKVAPVVAGATPAPAPIQDTSIIPGATGGSKFSFGGFVRTDMMMTNTSDGTLAAGSAGRDLFVPSATPVGGQGEGSYFDAHAKFSRVWFGVDNTTDANNKLTARVELDFFGGALGNEQATNTYGATIRHAYVGWNKWLIGQTWSNMVDTGSMMDSIDFVGATDGTMFARQPQVRYTSGAWSASIENPQTTITPSPNGARVATDDNSLPDFVLRYMLKREWGHMTAAFMMRQLANETATFNDNQTVFGGSFSGKVILSPNDDLRFMINAGEGLNRYTGLGIASDAVIDGSELEAISGISGYVGYRHVFNPKLRGNVYYAMSKYDNNPLLTGTSATESTNSLSLNMIYTPTPKLDLGFEYRMAERELESGDEGDLRRLHFIGRYAF